MLHVFRIETKMGTTRTTTLALSINHEPSDNSESQNRVTQKRIGQVSVFATTILSLFPPFLILSVTSSSLLLFISSSHSGCNLLTEGRLVVRPEKEFIFSGLEGVGRETNCSWKVLNLLKRSLQGSFTELHGR